MRSLYAQRLAEYERELGPNHDRYMVDDCHMPERIKLEHKPSSSGLQLTRWTCRCGRLGVWLESEAVALRNSTLHICGNK